MDYGQLLQRAWNLIWNHKFLILLGLLVALGGGQGTNINFNVGGGVRDFEFGPPQEFDFRFEEWEDDFDFDFDFDGQLAPLRLAVPLVIGLIIVGVLVGLVLWVIATIAEGGLIAGANALDAGMASDFSTAWNAGWQKGWRLLGISILPAIPALLIGIVGLFSLLGGLAVLRLFDARAWAPVGLGILPLLLGFICVIIPLVLLLNALATLAYRACMLEDLGVFASYRRGIDVLFGNLGEAVVLFLLQVALSIVLGVGLSLFSGLACICCLLWPLLLLIQGTVAAYFSTLWTLAWRRWTGLHAAVTTFA